MIHYKEYKLQWSLFSWFAPKIMVYINDFLSFFSTILLVIPFSVLILSFLIPESKGLKLASGLIAVTSITFSLVRGVFTNTLGQAFNIGFLVVTHMASLEAKQEVFCLEFSRLSAELCQHATSKLHFINKFLTHQDFIIYDNKLRVLDTFDEVKQYAKDVVMHLDFTYNQLHKTKPFKLTEHVEIKTIIIVVVISVIFIGAFYYFTNSDEGLKKVVNLQAEGAGNAVTSASIAAISITTVQATEYLKNELVACGMNQLRFEKKLSELTSLLGALSEKVHNNFGNL